MYPQSAGQVSWNERPGGAVDISTGGGGHGDVYRRFQDIDDGSNSSASNDTESTTLLDETNRKNERLYDITPTERRDRYSRGSTKNKILLFFILVVAIYIMVMGKISNGNDRGRIGTIAGWGLNTSRQTIDYVLPYENTTLIDPLNVCSTEERAGLGDERDKVYLLIVVCSAASNFEARQTIRQTWGNVREFNYDQFPRLHERLRGNYLEPNEMKTRGLKDYTWTMSNDEAIAATTQSNEVVHSKRNSSHSSEKNNNNNNNSSNSSSNTSSNSFGNLNLNIKVVFLIGQLESDYIRQHQRSEPPPVGDELISVDPSPAGGTGTPPRLSLFPSGGDVDPAFNVGSGGAELQDETQLRIMNESEVYGDIIQESFIDSYNNLTLKTIMMLKWVTNNCDGKVKFIMKCDDDTFVNVPNLLHVLLGGTVPLYKAAISFYDAQSVRVKSSKNRLVEAKHLLTGFLFCEAKPIGDTSSKWYSPTYMYDKDVYPNYLSGTAYLMNLEAVKTLYRASLSTPIFHLEDVYLTGIVADRAKIGRRHHPLFFYSYTKDLCALRGMISQHQLQPSEIRAAYDYITNSSIVCNGPGKKLTVGQQKLQVRTKCQ